MAPWKSRYLDITTATVCPVNCYPYCPQAKFTDAYGDSARLLSFDDFALALSHVPKDVGIAFSGFCEPFINPRAPEMIRLAKAQGHEVRIYTTLTGLRWQDVAELQGCDDYLVLHLPDNKGVSHIPTTDNWRMALTEVLTTLRVDHFMTMGDGFVSNDRAGNCDNAKPRHVRGPFHCDLLHLPQPVMLPNCEVVACWMDFSLRHRVGNLKTQTYDEIVSGEAFRRIVSNRWKWDGTELCRSCKMATPIYKWIPQTAYSTVVTTFKRTKSSVAGSE
jgi:radical SAM protein with 4Fe4S-binding SPASM domain